MCRYNGYVYTYRLHKDDAGSWAAEVRHFYHFISSALILCRLFPLPKTLQEQQNSCTSAPLWLLFISSRGCFGARLIQQAVNLRQTWGFFFVFFLQEWQHWEMGSFPLAITPSEIFPSPNSTTTNLRRHSISIYSRDRKHRIAFDSISDGICNWALRVGKHPEMWTYRDIWKLCLSLTTEAVVTTFYPRSFLLTASSQQIGGERTRIKRISLQAQ